MNGAQQQAFEDDLASLPAGSLDFLQQAGATIGFIDGRLTLEDHTGERLSVNLAPSHGRPPLLKAALAGGAIKPLVADATAGMAGDAFDLAHAGCAVVAFERSPLVWLLLRDGLFRAGQDPQLAAAAARIELHHGDAAALLPQHGPFDVVVLDPMWQGGKGSAGKRKSMRLFHELAGPPSDEAALLEAARGVALRRVVAKRPARGPFLAGVKPSGSLTGRTVRFDLYAPIADQS